MIWLQEAMTWGMGIKPTPQIFKSLNVTDVHSTRRAKQYDQCDEW